MPGMNDFHAFKSTGGKSGGGKNSNFGCGWVVIVLVICMLLFFLANGAGWDAIDTLLGLGFLAFLFAKAL